MRLAALSAVWESEARAVPLWAAAVVNSSWVSVAVRMLEAICRPRFRYAENTEEKRSSRTRDSLITATTDHLTLSWAWT